MSVVDNGIVNPVKSLHLFNKEYVSRALVYDSDCALERCSASIFVMSPLLLK